MGAMSFLLNARVVMSALLVLFFITVFFTLKDVNSMLNRSATTSPILNEAIYQSSFNTIEPIPEFSVLNPPKVALGEKLFFDPRLSKDNSTACVSCHLFSTGSADRRRVSVGVENKMGILNAPPVFNARFNLSQFWDGRAKDLYEQMHGPLTNPVEMGNHNLDALIAKLRDITDYQVSFNQVYDDGLTADNLRDAIVEYEHSLVTPNARFDQYLKGHTDALTPTEVEGYHLFQDLGCIACHNGINIGGNLFQKAGIFSPIMETENVWQGRYAITGNIDDLYVLKVPSLRNIAHTAPYFHDGSAATLSEAIRTMAKAQLGRDLSEDEVNKLEQFLISLTGKYKGAFVGHPY